MMSSLLPRLGAMVVVVTGWVIRGGFKNKVI